MATKSELETAELIRWAHRFGASDRQTYTAQHGRHPWPAQMDEDIRSGIAGMWRATRSLARCRHIDSELSLALARMAYLKAFYGILI
jgi:hypothetical protein